jgi:mismatch-specific thymine-DNA glycosylase
VANFQTTITVNGEKYKTLKDILPRDDSKLKILFIGKTPALNSVEVGHYFQGNHGKFFWDTLHEYGILNFRKGLFQDENLIENRCGITDIVKVPRNYGNEPSSEEYKAGLERILRIIEKYRPKIIVFIYKKVLDNILKFGLKTNIKTDYGFNPGLKSSFNSNVFVFPMPGTPCNKQKQVECMQLLKTVSKGGKLIIEKAKPLPKKELEYKSVNNHKRTNSFKKGKTNPYTIHWFTLVIIIAIIIYIIGQIEYGGQ